MTETSEKTEKKEVNEDRILPEATYAEDGYAFAMNHKEMLIMQETVKKRAAHPSFEKTFPQASSQDQRVLALYCHTAYEIGVHRGLNDVDKILSTLLNEKQEEKRRNDGSDLQGNK